LDDQGDDDQDPGDDRGPGEPEVQIDVEEVRGGLADRGAQNLDDPEPERDLRDLVEHLPAGRGEGML
jgi:hypothetical protein